MVVRAGKRIRARRERLGLGQEELAQQMQLAHRQTLGRIESGERKLRPVELAAAAQALDVPVSYFTDPFDAAGEAAFAFRADGVEQSVLDELEERGGRWLATYDALVRPSLLAHSLHMDSGSSYERAQEAGDATRQQLRLGAFPAHDLGDALEREWGVLVLNVDAPEGVSGVASRLHGVQAIFVNRLESAGRRNYNLAHEAFHLLTWDSMPPARVAGDRSARAEKRIEELANNFAAALLMPADSVRSSWQELGAGDKAECIQAMAQRFGVSAPAMKWRLLNLRLVAKSALPGDALLSAVAPGDERATPLLFNAKFVGLVYQAVETGRLSLRKACTIMGTTSHGFAELCRSYGRVLSYEI